MKSLQDYRDIYRQIAQDLGYRGDSVELLVQLLSNASYIEEVENIKYMEEASFSTAVLENSKIQHCVDMMYSVFRGSCPRVLLRFKPTGKVSYKMYDEIITSSNFSVFYVGYLLDTEARVESYKDILVEDTLIASPTRDERKYTIVGLIAPSLEKKEDINIVGTNHYYIEFPDSDISNDSYLEVQKDNNTSIKYKTTREFSEHILDNKVFDLTIPGYGCRLYFKGTDIETSDTVNFSYFPYISLDSLQTNELKRLSLKNTTLVNYEAVGDDGTRTKDTLPWDSDLYENIGTGIYIVPDTPKEDLSEIHYNANRNRYVNSIVRSNTDMGDLLVRSSNGVVRDAECIYESDGRITLYYIPTSESNPMSDVEKERFKKEKIAYYITSEMEITKGTKLDGILNVSLVVYSQDDQIEQSIREIISKYEYKFSLAGTMRYEFEKSIKNKILSELSKLDSVRYVKDISFTTTTDIKDLENLSPLLDENGEVITTEDGEEVLYDLSTCYYSISLVINTSTSL